ncbi:MAG: hypothetical protein CVV37_01260 [Nitrospira bacterium HGW-Nitrospira-1]|nr:MAG: hypothetical protein CVV37_01260 [Nitrospira bacterium HGW-Nitrospira-1]
MRLPVRNAVVQAQIIKESRNGFNVIELDKDRSANSYIKAGVEPSWWWKPKEEIKARILEPTMTVEILRNLKNFVNVKWNL